MKKQILLILSLLLVMLSCQKDDKPSIVINNTIIDISEAGGSQTISFESNVNWTAKSSESWCTLSQVSGNASTKSVSIVVNANNTLEPRSSTISFTIEGLTKTVKVNQSAASLVATPLINPNGGLYTTAQTITITSATDGAEIRYTLDGNNPTETSQLYSNPFVIEQSATIKAKAFKKDWIDSSIASVFFSIGVEANLIVGSTNAIQHINASGDFVFQLNGLNEKDVFFVFSNKNEKFSVPLPQLQSNVETMSRASKTTSFVKAPSFIVSGKPSITKFNNNPTRKFEKGVTKPLYNQQKANSTNLEVGTSEYFFDDLGNKVNSTVRKVISAHGKNLYVWVANDCWTEGGTKKYNVTQQMVDAIAPKFLSPGDDNDIYEWVTNAAGDHWGATPFNNLIPGTDDIHIWLTDIDNDNTTTGTVTLGYYYSRDNFTKASYSDSNEKLMFAIDAVLFAETKRGGWSLSNYWPQEVISTLAHEFTHMIYFYQHSVLTDQEGDIPINEMSAQCVEDLVASKILADGPRGVPYATPSAGNTRNTGGRLPLYNSNNHYNLLEWSDSDNQTLINYSKTYALGAYLMRNYGGANFIRELIQNNSTGINSIVAAVNSNGGAGLNYGDILQRFGVATLLSDQTSVANGYKLNTVDWSTSTVNGINYNLGAINLYNYSPLPTIYNELPKKQNPNSNILYKAGGNLSGTKEWHFKGMDSDTKLTVVIK